MNISDWEDRNSFKPVFSSCDLITHAPNSHSHVVPSDNHTANFDLRTSPSRKYWIMNLNRPPGTIHLTLS